jgi:hypothetical protein
MHGIVVCLGIYLNKLRKFKNVHLGLCCQADLTVKRKKCAVPKGLIYIPKNIRFR